MIPSPSANNSRFTNEKLRVTNVNARVLCDLNSTWSEDFSRGMSEMVGPIEDINFFAIHAKKVTIIPKDMQTATRVSLGVVSLATVTKRKKVVEARSINSDDETTTANIRDNKKQKLKQTRAIITQFDKIATNFQSAKKSAVGADSTIANRDGSEKVETAGMIKKRARDKKKKEKTLSAKLRLKTKKGGGDK